MCLYEASRLLAFVVASTSGEQTSASVQEQEGQTQLDQTRLLSPSEETRAADGALSRLILNQLSLLVPAHSVPDTLVLVPALSLTRHGENQTHTHPCAETHHTYIEYCNRRQYNIPLALNVSEDKH